MHVGKKSLEKNSKVENKLYNAVGITLIHILPSSSMKFHIYLFFYFFVFLYFRHHFFSASHLIYHFPLLFPYKKLTLVHKAIHLPGEFQTIKTFFFEVCLKKLFFFLSLCRFLFSFFYYRLASLGIRFVFSSTRLGLRTALAQTDPLTHTHINAHLL